MCIYMQNFCTHAKMNASKSNCWNHFHFFDFKKGNTDAPQTDSVTTVMIETKAVKALQSYMISFYI